MFCLSPVITIDAMRTQHEIVRRIQVQSANYILALKANHHPIAAMAIKPNNRSKLLKVRSNHTKY
jgi:predicted transposase YbfD/YdcC